MEGLSLNLPLLLKAVNDILVAPADFMRQTLNSTELPPRLQPQNPQRLRHNHTLLPVIWRGNTLKEFEALKSCRAASSLVGHHTTDSTEKDLGRSSVMEGAGFFGVHNVALVEEVVVAQLVAEEAAGDVDLLTPNHDNFLARKDLLGYNGGQPAQEMTLAINDDGAGGKSGHGVSSGRNPSK